jgi:asparagine synthase (glutamine-hydrolysing)
MNAAMEHRGPDDEGTHVDEVSGFALGARRLSIIDTARGHQPMSNEDGTVWAVLNGEIYNHPALLERLRRRGHQLATSCDTEVLVHLYEDFGDDLVHALEGMYAFAIWDTNRQRLLIGRDRFGEKPLFYAEPRRGALIFASELRALLSEGSVSFELDAAALDRFFVFSYAPGPGSMVKGVRQLPPGCTLTWSVADPRVRLHRYWTPKVLPPTTVPSARELVAETRRLMETAVESRMISDVPLGVFLSGGVDSTLIAAIAARLSPGSIKTFSVGYGTGEMDEREEAAATARELGAEHRELVLGGDDLVACTSRVLRKLDQPIADPALIALSALSEFARQDVKVAVGGEGADELFAGYPRYRWLGRSEGIARLPALIPTMASRTLERLPSGVRARRLATVLRPSPTIERHLDWVTAGRRSMRPDVYGPVLRDAAAGTRIAEELGSLAGDHVGDAAGRHMLLDQRHWLPDDVLSKADRASMLASVELRTPYLHRGLVEFAATVPSSLHLRKGGKALLRAVLHAEMPTARASRPKRAFQVPLGDWLRGPLRPLLRSQLDGGSVFDKGLFDRRGIRSLGDEHERGARDNSGVLWPFLCLGLWLDSWGALNGG